MRAMRSVGPPAGRPGTVVIGRSGQSGFAEAGPAAIPAKVASTVRRESSGMASPLDGVGAPAKKAGLRHVPLAVLSQGYISFTSRRKRPRRRSCCSSSRPLLAYLLPIRDVRSSVANGGKAEVPVTFANDVIDRCCRKSIRDRTVELDFEIIESGQSLL